VELSKGGFIVLMKLLSKKNISLGLLCISIPAFAAMGKLIKLNFEYPTFKKSTEAESFIRFTMVHRKFKTLTEKFDGTVKSFVVSGQIEGESFENPEVKFNVLDMDTDNGMRNDKMQKESLSAKRFPQITVNFGQSLKLGTQNVNGTMTILGNKKPILLPISIQDNGNAYKASGHTSVLLSALGVPKPNFISESIASIDDRVELNYQVILPKSKI
jgi:polyisoprenoid-binding protein YceI